MNGNEKTGEGAAGTPAESRETAAKEAFAHGLLEFSHRDTRETQEARIRRAMAALGEDAGEQESRRMRFPTPGRRALRLILSAAASVVLLGVVSLYFGSTEPTAMALVQASIDAAQKSPVRRYEVRASADIRVLPESAHATLDVGSDRQFVIRAKTERGEQIAGGRGAEGEWAIKGNGEVETEEARAYWPRWIFLLDESLTGSPDDILVGLERDFELRVDSTETVDGVKCRHIHAVRRDEPREARMGREGEKERGAGPGPENAGEAARPGPREGGRDGEPRGPMGPRGGRGRMGDGGPPGGMPEGGDERPLGPGPGVAPELAPFLHGLRREGRPEGEGPEGGRGGPGHERGPGGPPRMGRFVPPDFVPRGEARARLPKSIDLWVDAESMIVQRVAVWWDGPRPMPAHREGMPRHPGPPARLEFRLVETPETGEGWFDAGAHGGGTK
jgi:hypothetical protein